VIQPTSAVQKYTSDSFRSKTYFIVIVAPRRYPALVCRTPLGFPVEPLV
jgi:hypothetical protein